MLDDGQQAIPAVSGGTTSDVRADSSERNREEQQQAVTSTSTQCAGGEIHEPASAIGLAVRSADASAVIPQLQVMASKDQRHQEGNNMGAHDDERETPRVLRACASLGPSSRHASPRAKYQPSTKKEGALPLVNLGKSNTMSPELLQHTFQQQDTFSSESIIAGLCHGRGQGAMDSEVLQLGVDSFASMPGTALRQTIFFLTGFSVAAVAGELALFTKLSNETDCSFLQAGMDETCRSHSYYTIARVVEYCKYLAVLLLFSIFFLTKLWKVARLQYHQWRNIAPPAGMDGSLWTCAASRDIFVDAVVETLAMHRLVLFNGTDRQALPASLMNRSARLSAILLSVAAVLTCSTMLAANLTSQALADAADEFCGGGGMSVCQASLRVAGVLPNINIATITWAFAVFAFTPLGFWSAAAKDALKVTRNVTMQRLLNLHWIFLPSMAATAALFAQQCLMIRTFTAESTGVTIFLWGNLAVLIYNAVIIFIAMRGAVVGVIKQPSSVMDEDEESGLLTGPVSDARRGPARTSPSFRRIINKVKNLSTSARSFSLVEKPEGSSDNGVHSVTSEELTRESENAASNVDGSQQRRGNAPWYHRWLIQHQEGSVRLQQAVVALCVMYLWCISHFANNVVHFSLLWVLRLAYLVVFGLCCDPECSFNDLEESNSPGMGLVLDARQLRRAVEAVLAEEEFDETIRTYKASLIRMQDTLAVSYRYQQKQEIVAPRIKLNMSSWQLTNLVKAVKNSNAKYIWIDKCSIVQSPGNLHSTLANRTMAVYSSAGATLALRSLESSHNRYHQRLWCAQEFCNARTARIATQAREEDSPPGIQASVYHNAVLIGKLRRQVRDSTVPINPWWLYGASSARSEIDAEEMLVKIKSLSVVLYSTKDTDLLRALYPMICSTSVANEMELVKLVEHIANTTSSAAPEALAQLKARN